jgi:hypothetical protein
MDDLTPAPTIIGPVPPVMIGNVEEVAFVIDDIWRGLATQPPARVYISTQGDWWDLIALRCYGMRRGDDHLMHKLIEANYELREVSKFPGGIQVLVPPIEIKLEIPLVPWKKAAQIPT